MRTIALLASIWLVSGCESLRGVLDPPTPVDVPVAVSCLPEKMPARPRLYSDAELARLDEYKLVLALWHNSDEAQAYVRELEALLRACK